MVATTSHIFSGKVDTENNNESDPDASLHVTYATTSALNTGLSTKQDSGSYATTSALNTGLQTTRTQLDQKLQITRTQLDHKLQTTRTQLEGDLQTTRTQLEGDLQTARTQLEGQLQAEKIENEINRLKLANAESRIAILEQSFGSILSKLNV
jgi:hypothetical protein